MSLESPDAVRLVDAPPLPLKAIPRSWRAWLLFFGVICPTSCIQTALRGVGTDKPWQSGQIKDYALLALKHPTLLIAYPLILWSMGCLLVWCIRPSLERWMALRLGVYSGAPLALLYTGIATAAEGPSTWVATVVVVPFWGLFFLLFRAAGNRKWRLSLGWILLTTACIAGIVAILKASMLGPQGFQLNQLPIQVLFVSFAVLMCAAPLAGAIAFFIASLCIWRNQKRHSSKRTHWIVAWSSYGIALGVTWRLTIQTLLAEYEKLPTENPNCYVSSAAAHGHRRLVRSTRPWGDAGPVINRQMQQLKLLEFALEASFPNVHSWIRVLYNRIGPQLARACQFHPIIADLTYLALVPWEVFAELVRIAAGISESSRDQIYLGRSKGKEDDGSGCYPKTPRN